MDECEKAFQALKEHFSETSFLSKPKVKKVLLLYLAILEEAISSILERE